MKVTGNITGSPADYSSQFHSGKLPVIDLLSSDPEHHQKFGGDWLYKLIESMVFIH